MDGIEHLRAWERARRCIACSPGFFRDGALRRQLAGCGLQISAGAPRSDDAVVVWGRKPWSRPGRLISRITGAPLITIEDGFLRSVAADGRAAPPLSLLVDADGVHYDASRPSLIERMIEARAGANGAMIARAERGIELLRSAGVSKYNDVAPGGAPAPAPGYVLVIDQLLGDAASGPRRESRARFRFMLDAARRENPDTPIVVKRHPAERSGRRRGHFGPADLQAGERLFDTPINPWDILRGARVVYTVSSQLGYEAMLAGKRLRVFGRPFYAGWGLSEDEHGFRRRTARPSVEEVFAVTHLLAPVYVDPWRGAPVSFEEAVDILLFLRTEHLRLAGPGGATLAGFRRWKRSAVRRFFIGGRPRFVDPPGRAVAAASTAGSRLWFWASRVPNGSVRPLGTNGCSVGYVEDGFLRSVGLGAALTPPLSLSFDPDGIHYDPARPSRLERLIGQAAELAPDAPERVRARALIRRIVDAGLSKYNLGSGQLQFDAAGRKVVVVAGQVEDDASVLRGAGEIRTNLALLRAARKARPEAFLIYKPHPDVEVGLRRGRIGADELTRLGDLVASGVAPAALSEQADELWTMTSLMGFEALLRGCRVVCTGAPFYAGWGLTRDLGPVPARRTARPAIDALAWAALIAYPTYVDPLTGLLCPAEVAVERLIGQTTAPQGNGCA